MRLACFRDLSDEEIEREVEVALDDRIRYRQALELIASKWPTVPPRCGACERLEQGVRIATARGLEHSAVCIALAALGRREQAQRRDEARGTVRA